MSDIEFGRLLESLVYRLKTGSLFTIGELYGIADGIEKYPNVVDKWRIDNPLCIHILECAINTKKQSEIILEESLTIYTLRKTYSPKMIFGKIKGNIINGGSEIKSSK